MTHAQMQRWRSFFEASKADIWTVIHQAITVAALDHPQEFPNQRTRIAEILFDKSLLAREHAVHGFHVREEGAATSPRDRRAFLGDGDFATFRDPYNDDAKADNLFSDFLQSYDEAEVLSDELDEQALILRDLKSIREILQDADQPEGAILEALQRLQYMHITMENLKATEIGKPVWSLKKHPSKKIQCIAKGLVRQWKGLLDAYLTSIKDMEAAAVVASGTDAQDYQEIGTEGHGLPAPPLDEGAFLAASDPVDLSQLFSFVESAGDLSGTEIDNDHNSSAYDMCSPSAKLEREEAVFKRQGDHHNKNRGGQGMHLPNNSANHMEPTRSHATIIKRKPVVSLMGTKTAADGINMSRNNMSTCVRKAEVGNRVKLTADGNNMKLSNMTATVRHTDKKSFDNEVQERLVAAKRKLQEGYKQADNAKKQRTVQILDPSEVPKSSQAPKVKGRTSGNRR
ncbi:hypothetical protein KP509_15G055300 [Ceratopteris richardii]|uniref:TFIIS N-terminal domain-containing protein n=1 Tax=Ceratopteris richardii TaxID=49495 RepID=A0A8T2T786_CERRI|nr:hypothetical protein KP509_15G055300 [Ceratopteris richardii]KAH7405069.1 hypothetical protein KP509_15G055300 [Ceratopteris richardii]KAH7405071.1 hypothetical protein KP509_15G055300 [Ceratopteris richardii]